MLASPLTDSVSLAVPHIDSEPIVAILLLGLLAWFLLFAVLRLVFALIQAFYATMIVSVIILAGMFILGFGRSAKTKNPSLPPTTPPPAAQVLIPESTN
jgi:hypothetical protein